jgi:adenylate cyclase
VLHGREFLSHRTRDQNDEAQKMFQRAIDLDPNYAAAYAALGGAYYETVVSGWTEFREDEIERAESLAQKGLALDPVTTSAYRLLSNIDMYRRRYDLALGQIDRALEINPSDAENYWQRGNILVWAGRAEEAVPWLEGVLRFDRCHTLTSQDLCIAYYFLHRYGEAVEAGDRALARGPGRSVQTETHPFLAAAYAQMGREQDAEGERVIVMRLAPFFDPRRFAAQFGTQEARDHILEGLKKAGFR